MASRQDDIDKLKEIADAAIDLGRPATPKEKEFIDEMSSSSHAATAARARTTRATLKTRGLWR